MGQRLAASPVTRTRARVRFVAAAALTCAFLATSHARADDSAADHAKRARTAYDLQNWPTAIQEYQAAYGADQKPEYLFGLGQAQRQSGDFAGAIASFKAYKRSDSVTPQQATAAELLITKCEGEQTKKEIEAAQKKNDASPTPPPTSGTTTPRAAQGQPPPPPPRDEGPKHFYQDFLGDLLVGVGIVAGGVGTYFLISGNSDMNAAGKDTLYKQYDSDSSNAKTKQTIGAVTMSAGGALIVGGVIRWMVSTSPKKDAPTTGFFVGPGSVGVVGRF